jgi:hypothetical protein
VYRPDVWIATGAVVDVVGRRSAAYELRTLVRVAGELGHDFEIAIGLDEHL